MRTAKTLIADLSLRWAHMPHCWFCHEVAQFFMRIAKTLIADLSLRWAHMPNCWFCHEVAQLCVRFLLVFDDLLILLILFRISWWTSAGKELWLSACAVLDFWGSFPVWCLGKEVEFD